MAGIDNDFKAGEPDVATDATPAQEGTTTEPNDADKVVNAIRAIADKAIETPAQRHARLLASSEMGTGAGKMPAQAPKKVKLDPGAGGHASDHDWESVGSHE